MRQKRQSRKNDSPKQTPAVDLAHGPALEGAGGEPLETETPTTEAASIESESLIAPPVPATLTRKFWQALTARESMRGFVRPIGVEVRNRRADEVAAELARTLDLPAEFAVANAERFARSVDGLVADIRAGRTEEDLSKQLRFPKPVRVSKARPKSGLKRLASIGSLLRVKLPEAFEVEGACYALDGAYGFDEAVPVLLRGSVPERNVPRVVYETIIRQHFLLAPEARFYVIVEYEWAHSELRRSSVRYAPFVAGAMPGAPMIEKALEVPPETE